MPGLSFYFFIFELVNNWLTAPLLVQPTCTRCGVLLGGWGMSSHQWPRPQRKKSDSPSSSTGGGALGTTPPVLFNCGKCTTLSHCEFSKRFVVLGLASRTSEKGDRSEMGPSMTVLSSQPVEAAVPCRGEKAAGGDTAHQAPHGDHWGLVFLRGR